MKTNLWQHQNDGVAFASTRPGTLLAWEMGTGKSAAAIAICEEEQAKRVLILCPLSVVGVWPAQFERHSSQAWQIVRLDSGNVASKTETARKALKSCADTVIIINHESSWREPFKTLALTSEWDVVIIDECHKIKAPGGKFSMFAALLARREKAVRLGLSGTPMPHSPLDIYGVARFIDPSYFGTSNSLFRARYAIMGGYQNHEVVGYQNMDHFEKRLAGFMHRVQKADVLDLPPEVDETRLCQLEPSAKKIYKELSSQFIAQIDQGLITASNALVKLLRLQQITSGFAPITNDSGEVVSSHQISTAKADLLCDTLEDTSADIPVVVFCRFLSDLRVVEQVAANLKRKYGQLSGERKDGLSKDATIAPGVQILGVQIQSGGVGVDLSKANVAIYYSVGFSLGELLQARGRLHRPGQENKVTHIFLAAEGTIDEVIFRALEKRRDLVESVLEEVKKRQEGR